MNVFGMLGSMSGSSLGGLSSLDLNDRAGGFRTMIDMAQKHQVHSMGDIMKEFMTNAPEGVSQFTKGPWNFG